MSIGNNIRRMRLDAGLTQEELAGRLGVARSTITQWERGWTQPRMGMVRKLAVVFGTTNSAIVAEEDGRLPRGGATGTERLEAAGAGAASQAADRSIGFEACDVERIATVAGAEDCAAGFEACGARNPAARAESVASDSTVGHAGTATAHAGASGASAKASQHHSPSLGPSVAIDYLPEGLRSSDSDDGQDRLQVPAYVVERHPQARAIIVSDASVERLLPKGMAAVFDPEIRPTNGQLAVVRLSKSKMVLVRKWYRGGNTIMLAADSREAFDDVILRKGDKYRVLGTVVFAQTYGEMR